MNKNYIKTAAVYAGLTAFAAAAYYIGGTSQYADMLALLAGSTPLKQATMQAVYAAAAVLWVLATVTVLCPWERKLRLLFSGAADTQAGGFFALWRDTAQLLAAGEQRPATRDKVLYELLPVVAFAVSVTAAGAVALVCSPQGLEVYGGLFVLCAASLIAGLFGSAAMHSTQTRGSARAAVSSAQNVFLAALPLTLSVLPAAMLAGGDSGAALCRAQSGGILSWFIFRPVAGQLAFVVFMLASGWLIKQEHPNAKAGFSGATLAFGDLAGYARLMFFSAFAALVFFGAGEAPFAAARILPSWFWLTAKIFASAAVYIWIAEKFSAVARGAAAHTVFKYLLPAALLNITVTGAYLCLK